MKSRATPIEARDALAEYIKLQTAYNAAADREKSAWEKLKACHDKIRRNAEAIAINETADLPKKERTATYYARYAEAMRNGKTAAAAEIIKATAAHDKAKKAMRDAPRADKVQSALEELAAACIADPDTYNEILTEHGEQSGRYVWKKDLVDSDDLGKLSQKIYKTPSRKDRGRPQWDAIPLITTVARLKKKGAPEPAKAYVQKKARREKQRQRDDLVNKEAEWHESGVFCLACAPITKTYTYPGLLKSWNKVKHPYKGHEGHNVLGEEEFNRESALRKEERKAKRTDSKEARVRAKRDAAKTQKRGKKA